MKEYEALDCIGMLEYADRTTKELTRYQLLVAINSMSKRKFDAKEIMKLPWDEKYHDKLENAYNEETAKYLDEQSSELEEMLNAGMFKMEDTNMMGS